MKQKQSGSGLIFAVVLLFVILGIVITLSSVTVLETKMSQKTKSSVGAFYNADSGVEWALNKIASSSGATIATVFSGQWQEANDYAVCPMGGCNVYFLDALGKVIITGTETPSNIKAVRAVGTQSTGDVTQRAIEAAVGVSNSYSYTYWCYDGYGTPVCPSPVTIGTQGPCDSGFTVKRDLGQFGYCVNTSGIGDYLSIPGGTCNLPEGKVGHAFVCAN